MTAPAFSIRPYQQAAIDSVISARKRGVRRMIVCLPTGAGKTVIFARLAAIARRPVLVLAHRAELVEQARDKLQRALADAGDAGGVASVSLEQGERRADPGAKVVVCSIRSLREERLQRLVRARAPGLVVYDECHHAAAEDNQRVLRSLGAFDPRWEGTLLGFTATTARGDGVGLERVFDEIVYTRGLPEMMADGYLSPLRGYRIATEADLRGLRGLRGGDFAVEELAEAVDIDARNGLVARSIQELARDRRTIAFCVTVAHATSLARALREVGVAAGVVHGELPAERRAAVLAAFRRGDLQVVTNVGVLTEGFDDPGVSCVAMARPTRSSGLYAQCVGRGTRLHPGKRDCLVLDFVDLSALELVTLPSLFGMPRGLNLQGEEVSAAADRCQQLLLDAPGLELDPGEITLAEIEERAAAFDPLTLRVDPDVSAISPNAWCSLGSAGLALHVRRGRRAIELLVLARGRGASRYQVRREGKRVAAFSRIDEAVEAVDYEVERMGRGVAASARPGAPWRREPVPADLAARLAALRPPRPAVVLGDALKHLSFAEHGPGRRRRG